VKTESITEEIITWHSGDHGIFKPKATQALANFFSQQGTQITLFSNGIDTFSNGKGTPSIGHG
jgi:hypothetical protein